MIDAGDVVSAGGPVTPMQTAGVSAPRLGTDAVRPGRTDRPALGVWPAAIAGCAFICGRRPEFAFEITGQAWRAPTAAARSRRIDDADFDTRLAGPGALMQQM